MNRVNYKLFLFSVVLSGLFSLAGISQEIEIELNWGGYWDTVSTPRNNAIYPRLENVFFDGSHFLYLERFDRTSRNQIMEFEVISYETADLNKKEIFFVKNLDQKISEEVDFELKNISVSGKPISALELVPFVEQKGIVKKITSVTFQSTKKDKNQIKSSRFADNSVLRSGSGDWYKVVVGENGIYKLDYDFLNSIGVDITNVNPNHINIYGNAFGRLPENNSADRPDDLLKNSIYVQGGQDGSFDEGDFILFYGRGPHKWELAQDNIFERTINNYSEASAYFININPNETPARIQSADLSSQPENNVVTDFNSFAIHELEERNLMKGGQRWYGEVFDAELNQSFQFNIPNVNTNASGFVKSFMASRTGNSNFEISYNNTLIGDAELSGVGEENYSRNGFLSFPGVFNPASSSITLDVRFTRSSPSDIGYLDFIEVNARSFLRFDAGFLEFRDFNSVGTGNVSRFQLSNFSETDIVWEITDRTNPKRVVGELNGSTYEFKIATDSLRTFVAFDASSHRTPQFIEKVKFQNLHGLPQADYLIVTHPLFSSQANRLKSLHEANGLSVHVVTTDQVYNEFSGGTQDPTAIKFFAKMFYERAEGDTTEMPKYLLLFGDGTYDPKDRVSNNNYMVPVYHTVTSESYIATLLSDDYFGFLDDGEAFSPSDELDIAVGRFVATTADDAKVLVDKVEHYMKNGSSIYAGQDLACGEDGFISTQGDWRLRYTLIGDDEDNGYFVNNDLESVYGYVTTNHPEMNAKKIYLDAYLQVTTAGGERYPDVNEEIDRSMETGAILTCYVGHGGSMGLAQERVVTIGSVQELENIDRLTLFASATCEFARIDDNELVSAGEWMALNEVGGAIALMTTTRAVFFSTNSITTDRFFRNVFSKNGDQEPLTFGEIITQTKNQVIGGSNNKRSFMLLGDPALTIALPYEKIVLDSVNQVDVTQERDTIRALSKVRMRGHVEDQFGNELTSYNGLIQPSIFDKPLQTQTLGQDSGSPVISFEQQLNILFRGNVTVQNGVFDFEFIVPKDINYAFGLGKASFYGYTEQDMTAGGYSKEFYVGGIDTTGLDDDQGPQIEIFLNDDSFVNGGLTDETPILIARLFDESGINTVGNGIGHDITLVLDANTSNAIVLNEYYEADLDTYKSGELSYQMSQLAPGLHTLTLKAWDVNNNSSERTLEFNVQESSEIQLDHVLNYPNPFTTKTAFFFEHNQVCAALETQIEIFTVTGRLVKTINQLVKTRGFRTEEIPWDGRDEFGDQLAKGVYVYRLTVRTPDGQEARSMEKLYLLK
jgi:hypothetical protein